MGAMTRLQIESLAQRHEAEPEWFLSICADIADGDSLDEAYAKLCNSYAVSWGALRTWIKVDPERERQYQDALAIRTEKRREMAAANVMKMAEVSHDKEKISPRTTLQAAAMVLESKTIGSAGSGAMPVNIQINFVDAANGRPA